jgi:hypothetical protein
VPEISRFFGITIRMFYDDHLPPHFHARYGGQQAVISLPGLVVLTGNLPPRALGLVMEWAAQHRGELWEDWTLARDKAPLKAIPPLE